MSQYKDPYEPISIMECHKCFERCSNDLYQSLVGFLLVMILDSDVL